MKKFEIGDKVVCNGNPEGIVLGYSSEGMVEVRLWQGPRLVGSVVAPEQDLVQLTSKKCPSCWGVGGMHAHDCPDRQIITHAEHCYHADCDDDDNTIHNCFRVCACKAQLRDGGL